MACAILFCAVSRYVSHNGRMLRLLTLGRFTATAAIREGYGSSVDLNSEALDSRSCPVLGDNPFIDEDGWMRSSRRDGADRLFWVPEENREYCWGNGNIGVIHSDVTKFDFRRFVHGENWTQCCTSTTDTEAV